MKQEVSYMENCTNVTSSFKTEINLCLRMLWLPHRNFSHRFMYQRFSVVYSDNSTKDLSTMWGKFLSFKSDGTYRVIQEESEILWEMIVCVILSKKVHMNMGPILNGYRDMVKRRYGPSCEHEQQLRNK